MATLEQNASSSSYTKADRDAAKDLLQCVLDDEFLFLLHFHHDLHSCALGILSVSYSEPFLSRCISGPIIISMQDDKVSYYRIMKNIKEKKDTISKWISQSTFTWGPTLAAYIKQTEKGTFGAFKIKLCDRQQLAKQCAEHVERLLKELDKRFAPKPVQEHMFVLFDPQYLIEHKEDIDSPEYGRLELDFIRNKYKNIIGFDSNAVRIEWESLKNPLKDFIDVFTRSNKEEKFWEQFLLYQKSVSSRFLDENKNILLLLSIYLISPTNSAECERGVSFKRVVRFVCVFLVSVYFSSRQPIVFKQHLDHV